MKHLLWYSNTFSEVSSPIINHLTLYGCSHQYSNIWNDILQPTLANWYQTQQKLDLHWDYHPPVLACSLYSADQVSRMRCYKWNTSSPFQPKQRRTCPKYYCYQEQSIPSTEPSMQDLYLLIDRWILMSSIWKLYHLFPSPSICIHQLVPASPFIDWFCNYWISKLTLLSPIHKRLLKRVSASQLLHSEINQKSTYDNFGWDASVGNQLIPLPLNDDATASVRNGVPVSYPEVLSVLGVSCECWKWNARKWWSGWKSANLIRSILAILYQVLRNL